MPALGVFFFLYGFLKGLLDPSTPRLHTQEGQGIPSAFAARVEYYTLLVTFVCVGLSLLLIFLVTTQLVSGWLVWPIFPLFVAGGLSYRVHEWARRPTIQNGDADSSAHVPQEKAS